MPRPMPGKIRVQLLLWLRLQPLIHAVLRELRRHVGHVEQPPASPLVRDVLRISSRIVVVDRSASAYSTNTSARRARRGASRRAPAADTPSLLVSRSRPARRSRACRSSSPLSPLIASINRGMSPRSCSASRPSRIGRLRIARTTRRPSRRSRSCSACVNGGRAGEPLSSNRPSLLVSRGSSAGPAPRSPIRARPLPLPRCPTLRAAVSASSFAQTRFAAPPHPHLLPRGRQQPEQQARRGSSARPRRTQLFRSANRRARRPRRACGRRRGGAGRRHVARYFHALVVLSRSLSGSIDWNHRPKFCGFTTTSRPCRSRARLRSPYAC